MKFRVVEADDTHDDVAVAIEVLGGGVHHEVRAEGQWPLEIRRQERVVHYDQAPGADGRPTMGPVDALLRPSVGA
eukprot:gene24810-biopygen25652